MKAVYILSLVIGVALAGKEARQKGQCPAKPPGGATVGICLFNPDINCTGDEQCGDGKLCCADGCNRSCQEAVPKVPRDPKLMCPLAGINPGVGVCTFDPNVNCLEDADCSSGQLCCTHGCNKKCKNPLGPIPYRPPTIPRNQDADDSCPPSSPTFGACVFDPATNCLDNSACSGGQVCCPSGCGKVCKNPVNKQTILPIEERTGKCPAAKSTIGACVFNPETSCTADEECKNGKVCCSVGCGKECVNPEPTMVHQSTRP